MEKTQSGKRIVQWLRALEKQKGRGTIGGGWLFTGSQNNLKPVLGAPNPTNRHAQINSFLYPKAPGAFNGRLDPSIGHPTSVFGGLKTWRLMRARNESNWSLWVEQEKGYPHKARPISSRIFPFMFHALVTWLFEGPK